MKTPKWTDEAVAKVRPRMLEMQAAGMGMQEIADEIGMCIDYARAAIKFGTVRHRCLPQGDFCECGNRSMLGRRLCRRCHDIESAGLNCPPLKVGSDCIIDEYRVCP